MAIYRSYIELSSPGKFPETMTPEMYIKETHPPMRRNPLIARTLYYSKDMESFATGLKRIQDACDEAGCKVEYRDDAYYFIVRFYRHCGEGWGTDENFKAPKHQGEALEIKVLKAVKDNPKIKQDELVKELSVSRASVQRIFKSLTERGVLERKGGKRFGYWEIHETD